MSRGVQVALIGLGSNFGKVAQHLLRQSPSINRLELYDDVKVCDVPALNGYGCKIRTHVGKENLHSALKNSDIIIIGDTCAQDALADNVPKILDYTKAMADVAPHALVVVAASPINSMVPLIAEAVSVGGVMDPHRILGCTTADSTMASRLLANALSMNPSNVILPVIGGSSSNTRVPIFTQAKPSLNFNLEKFENLKLGSKKGDQFILEPQKEPEGMRKAYAAVSFVNSLAVALKGVNNAAEIALYKNNLVPGNDFFALPIILGPKGIAKKFKPPKLSAYEEKMVELAVENIKKETVDEQLLKSIREARKGVEMDASSCPPKCPKLPCCPPPPCIPPKCPPCCPVPRQPCYPPPINPPPCEPCPQPPPCCEAPPKAPEPCCPPPCPCIPPPPPKFKLPEQKCSGTCDPCTPKNKCPPPHCPPPMCPPPCMPSCSPSCPPPCPPPPNIPRGPSSRDKPCPPPPACPKPCPPPCCPPPREKKPKCEDSPCPLQDNCTQKIKKIEKRKIHFPPPSPQPSCYQRCSASTWENVKKCSLLLNKLYANKESKPDCGKEEKKRCPPGMCPPQPCCPTKKKPCCPAPPPCPKAPCCPPPPPPCAKCDSKPLIYMRLLRCSNGGCNGPPPPKPCPTPCPEPCPPPIPCTPPPKCPSPGGPNPRCLPPCCPPCNKTQPCCPPPPCCPDGCPNPETPTCPPLPPVCNKCESSEQPPFLWLEPEGCPAPPGPPCPPAGPSSPCFPHPPCPPRVCPPPTCPKPCSKCPPPKCPPKPCPPPPPCCEPTVKKCLPFIDDIRIERTLSPISYQHKYTGKAINNISWKRAMSSKKGPKKSGNCEKANKATVNSCDRNKKTKDIPFVFAAPPKPLPRPSHKPAPPLPKLKKPPVKPRVCSKPQIKFERCNTEKCPEKPIALNMPIIKEGGGPRCPIPNPCTSCRITNTCKNQRKRPKCFPHTTKSYQTLANNKMFCSSNQIVFSDVVSVDSVTLPALTAKWGSEISSGGMNRITLQTKRGIKSLTAANFRKSHLKIPIRQIGKNSEKTEVSKESIINTFKGLIMQNRTQEKNKKKEESKLDEGKMETPKKKYVPY